MKHNEKLLNDLDLMFSGVDGGELRHEISKLELRPTHTTQLEKSVAIMYKELYDKVELENDFELQYETWANQEVFMFDVY